MGVTLKGRLNQSVPETREENWGCSDLICHFVQKCPMETATKQTEEDEFYSAKEMIRSYSSIIGILLLTFAGTKIPLTSLTVTHNASDAESCTENCDEIDQVLSGFSVQTAGLATIIIFTVYGMMQISGPYGKCNQKRSMCGM